MILKVDFHTNSDESFFVDINGQTKEVIVDEIVEFELDDIGEYELHIYQELPASKRSIISVVFGLLFSFVFTIIKIVIYGIFGIPDDDDWRDGICPWCIDYRAKLNVTKNTRVRIDYQKAVFFKESNSFSRPNITISKNAYSENTGYIPNYQGVKNKAFSRVMNMLSALLLAELLFSLILYHGCIKQNNVPMIIFVLALMVLFVIGIVIAIIFDIRQAKSVLNILQKS